MSWGRVVPTLLSQHDQLADADKHRSGIGLILPTADCGADVIMTRSCWIIKAESLRIVEAACPHTCAHRHRHTQTHTWVGQALSLS